MVSSTNSRRSYSELEREAAQGLALLDGHQDLFEQHKSILFSGAKIWLPQELECLCTAVAQEQAKKIDRMNWLEVAEKVHQVTVTLTLPKDHPLKWSNTQCRDRWTNLCDLYKQKVVQGKFIDDPTSIFHMKFGKSRKDVQKEK